MLASGQDSALLRYSLGSAYLDTDPENAVVHLQQAVSLDPAYSAAWKVLGKARTSIGDTKGATDAFETGMKVAEKNGDVQAMKEMRVFLRRLNKPPE